VIDYIPLTESAGRVVSAELRALAIERMRGLGYALVTTELTPEGAGVRFDVIGIARRTRQVRIYEIKASRADFLRDRKWPSYLAYCTHFAFVAPAGAIAPWELERGVGLIEYGAPTFARMRRARRFGATILREDTLTVRRLSHRLRDSVGDAEWIALLEACVLSGLAAPADEICFESGAGI